MFNKDEMKFPGTRGPDWNRFGSNPWSITTELRLRERRFALRLKQPGISTQIAHAYRKLTLKSKGAGRLTRVNAILREKMNVELAAK